MPLSEDENDPYNRWQGFRIAQLGLCIALFLTFSVATLGFSVNLLVQPTYAITGCFAKLFFLLSIVFGLLSVLFGSVACITRLADFRDTARVVRHRSNPNMAANVERWRENYGRFGRWTWRLFKSQLVAFALQVFLLTVTLAIAYWSRLT